MKGKRLLILGAAFALGLSACASVATRITKTAPLKEGDFGNICTLVTNINDLAEGDHVAIGGATSGSVKFLSSTQNNNNRAATTAIASTDGVASLSSSVEVLTLGKNGTNWTLYANLSTTKGYLCAASGSSNYLRTQTTLDDNGKWSVSIANTGVASIVAQGNYSRNVMQFNSSSNLFACYASASQSAVSIWKVGTSSEAVQLTAPVVSYNSDTNKVVWNDVEGASGYQVSINNQNNFVSATSPFGNFEANTEYTVYVKAIGDGENYTDSPVTSVTFTAVAPFDGADFVLCTSAADLVVGASYIITNGKEGTVKTMSTEVADNNRPAAEVTVVNSQITTVLSTMTFTLGGSSGAWTFHTDNYLGDSGYFASGTGTNNHLRVLPDGEDHCTISFGEGNVAVINFSTNDTRNTLRYNSTQNWFACYASGQNDVYLWKDADAGTAPVFGDLDHIKITTPATKTSFYVGETFSSAGIVLTGYDNANEASALTEIYSSGFTTDFDGKVFDSTDVGNGKTVTVTYNGKTDTYTINVKAPIEKNVSEALAIANALESGEVSADLYKVEGYIVSIVTAWSTQYNNITYNLGDAADSTETIEVYRSVAAEGTTGTLLKVGDKVAVTGYLKNHNGTTPEFNAGCSTALLQAAPAEKITVSEALTIANALENNAKSDKEYQIDGYIVSIVTAWSTQYSNISYNLGDTAGASTVIEVFRSSAANPSDGPDLKVGDKVNVVGFLTKYSDTPEFAQGCITTRLEVNEGVDAYTGAFSSFKKLNAKENGPETITFAELGLQNDVQYSDPFESGNYSVTFGGGANDGKYYTTGSGIRTYGDGTITIASSGANIKSIKFTWSGSYAPTSNVADVGEYDQSTSTWSGDSDTVVLTRPSGSGHWRLQSLTISSGGVTVDSVSLEFGAKIAKTTWSEFIEDFDVSEFGIMLFKTRQASVPTVEEVFEATPAKTVAINNTQYGVELEEDGDNYSFSVKVNISGSASYDIFFCAAPYVVVDGDYYFLDNMKYSVQSLAEYYLNHSGSNLSTDALNVLAGN